MMCITRNVFWYLKMTPGGHCSVCVFHMWSCLSHLMMFITCNHAYHAQKISKKHPKKYKKNKKCCAWYTWLFENNYWWIQGGEDSWDALSCRSFFAKEPLIIGLFCIKWPMKIRYPYDPTPPYVVVCVYLIFDDFYHIFMMYYTYIVFQHLRMTTGGYCSVGVNHFWWFTSHLMMVITFVGVHHMQWRTWHFHDVLHVHIF